MQLSRTPSWGPADDVGDRYTVAAIRTDPPPFPKDAAILSRAVQVGPAVPANTCFRDRFRRRDLHRISMSRDLGATLGPYQRRAAHGPISD